MDWIKPSGLEITTNDNTETVAYCESLGWKAAVDTKGSADPTVDGVKKMKAAGLKKLVAEYGLDVDTSLELSKLRYAVIGTLFEPEETE